MFDFDKFDNAIKEYNKYKKMAVEHNHLLNPDDFYELDKHRRYIKDNIIEALNEGYVISNESRLIETFSDYRLTEDDRER